MSIPATDGRGWHEADDRRSHPMPWSGFAVTDFSYRHADERLGADHAEWLRGRMHERGMSMVALFFHLFMQEQAAFAAGAIEDEPVFYETPMELPVPLARQVARYLLANGTPARVAGYTGDGVRTLGAVA